MKKIYCFTWGGDGCEYIINSSDLGFENKAEEDQFWNSFCIGYGVDVSWISPFAEREVVFVWMLHKVWLKTVFGKQ